MSVKADFIRLVKSLPEDATLDDIEDRLYLLREIHQGIAAIERGAFVSHEEVRAIVRSWRVRREQ